MPVILIYTVEKFWQHKNDELCISSITYAELLFGALHKGSEKLRGQIAILVNRLRVIDFTAEYAKIRQ
jgi:predicted nucleic acid-binding protein